MKVRAGTFGGHRWGHEISIEIRILAWLGRIGSRKTFMLFGGRRSAKRNDTKSVLTAEDRKVQTVNCVLM